MPEQGRDGNNLTIKPEADLSPIEQRVFGLLEKHRHLDSGRHKVNAQGIAEDLGYWDGKSTETKRRAVRAIIHSMRDKGVPVASDLKGYWLAVEPADFVVYQQLLRRMGLTYLASEARSKRSPARAKAAGQMAMF